MDCEQSHILMAPHILGDFRSGSSISRDLQQHLSQCSDCAAKYEEICQKIAFIRDHKVEFARAFEDMDRTTAREEEAQLEEGWKILETKLNAVHHQNGRTMCYGWLWKGMAACLVLAASAWWVTSIRVKSEIKDILEQEGMKSVPRPAIKIVQVSGTNKTIIPIDQDISTAADEHKTLVINDKHDIILNYNTTLSIGTLIDNNYTGCIVKLTCGEIFTHVEHDGNPFIVETIHGQAVITGTTFDIKTTETAMTLAVSEGTVRLESEKGMVEVKAGQLAKITGQSAPSPALACNIAEFTAWAKYCGSDSESAKTQVLADNFDISDLSFLETQDPFKLKNIDYDNWVEEHRDWFKQEFPWIFQLQDVLAKENIEVDYPELLIQSGNVWQFVCEEGSPIRFSVVDLDSLLNTVSDHGFDKKWLIENIPAAKSVSEKMIPSENYFTGIKTFERWLKYATDENESPMPKYSYHASKYLAQTRSLIWFAVREGRYDLSDKKRAEVLALLQKEVTIACRCQNEVLYSADEQHLSSCKNKCQKLANGVNTYIETMRAIEERIAEYEISNSRLRKGVVSMDG